MHQPQHTINHTLKQTERKGLRVLGRLFLCRDAQRWGFFSKTADSTAAIQSCSELLVPPVFPHREHVAALWPPERPPGPPAGKPLKHPWARATSTTTTADMQQMLVEEWDVRKL